MNRLFYLLAVLFVSTVAFAQPGDMPPNAEPGKCYAKCLLHNVKASPADTTFTTYYRYTGLEEVKLSTKYHAVRVDESGKVTERLPVEVPKKRRKLPPNELSLDTLYTYHAALRPQAGGFTEWREILCKTDLTEELVFEITTQLQNSGYPASSDRRELSSKSKAALVSFQRDKGLPIGQLDFLTLDALGVGY